MRAMTREQLLELELLRDGELPRRPRWERDPVTPDELDAVQLAIADELACVRLLMSRLGER